MSSFSVCFCVDERGWKKSQRVASWFAERCIDTYFIGYNGIPHLDFGESLQGNDSAHTAIWSKVFQPWQLGQRGVERLVVLDFDLTFNQSLTQNVFDSVFDYMERVQALMAAVPIHLAKDRCLKRPNGGVVFYRARKIFETIPVANARVQYCKHHHDTDGGDEKCLVELYQGKNIALDISWNSEVRFLGKEFSGAQRISHYSGGLLEGYGL